MVYNYIFDQKKLDIDFEGDDDYWITGKCGSRFRYSGSNPPYLLNPSCTHPTFAAELSQVLWRLARVWVGDARSLEATMLHDTFGTPTTPLDHICHLTVEISNECAEDAISEDGNESWVHSTAMRENLNAGVAVIDTLFASNTLKKLNIIIWGSRPVNLRTFEKVLLPAIHQLTGKGVEIHVSDYFGYGWIGELSIWPNPLFREWGNRIIGLS